MLANDVITALMIGARTVDQLRGVVGAVDVELSPDEIESLNQLSDGF